MTAPATERKMHQDRTLFKFSCDFFSEATPGRASTRSGDPGKTGEIRLPLLSGQVVLQFGAGVPEFVPDAYVLEHPDFLTVAGRDLAEAAG